MDYKEGLRLIETKEAKLSELKKLPKESAGEIYQLLLDIRNGYKACILFSDVVSSSSNSPQDKVFSKDLDGALWRTCFYKQIEEYRKSIKNTTLVIDNGANGDTSVVDKARGHLTKLTTALLRMLSESIQFYMELLKDLESNYHRKKTSRISMSIFKCLLYLGDLCRYYTAHGGRESGASNPDKCDFSTAHNYYERAFRVMPTSGNPHNQLAMLATHNKQDFVACYYYCRSILCQQPFNNGLVNLTSIFDTNKKLFVTIHGNEFMPTVIPIINLGLSASKAEKDKAADIKIKSFFVGFVRLQGIIFEVNKSMLSANQVADVQTLNISQYETLRDQLFTEMEELLPIIITQFGDSFLTQMFSVLLFSVQFSSNTHKSFAEKFPGQVSEVNSATELLSLITLYGHLKKVIAQAVRFQNSLKEKPSTKKTLFCRYLTCISLFCEWCTNRNRSDSRSSRNGSRSSNSNGSSPRTSSTPNSMEVGATEEGGLSSLVVNERRAYLSARSSLSLLISDIPNMRSDQQPASPKSHLGPMREHMELRGYSPFMPHIEKYFAGFDSIANSVTFPSEDESISRKYQNIRDFVSISTSSSPPPKSEDEDSKALSASKASSSQTESSKTLSQQQSSSSRDKINPKVKTSSISSSIGSSISNSNNNNNNSSPNVPGNVRNSNKHSHSEKMVQNNHILDGSSATVMYSNFGIGESISSVCNRMDLPLAESRFEGGGGGVGTDKDVVDGLNRIDDIFLGDLMKSSVQNSNQNSSSNFNNSTSVSPANQQNDEDDVDEEMFEYRPVTSRFVFASSVASPSPSEVNIDQTSLLLLGRNKSQDDLLTRSSSYNALNDPFNSSGHFDHLSAVTEGNIDQSLPPFFFDSLNGSNSSSAMHSSLHFEGGFEVRDNFSLPYSSAHSHHSTSSSTSTSAMSPILVPPAFTYNTGLEPGPPPGLPPRGLLVSNGSNSGNADHVGNSKIVGNGYFVQPFKTENPFFSEY